MGLGGRCPFFLVSESFLRWEKTLVSFSSSYGGNYSSDNHRWPRLKFLRIYSKLQVPTWNIKEVMGEGYKVEMSMKIDFSRV